MAHFEEKIKRKQEAVCKRTSGISTLLSSWRRGQAGCAEPVLLCLLPNLLKSGCFSLLPVKFCMRLSKHLHMFAAAEYLCRCLSASVANCNQGNLLKKYCTWGGLYATLYKENTKQISMSVIAVSRMPLLVTDTDSQYMWMQMIQCAIFTCYLANPANTVSPACLLMRSYEQLLWRGNSGDNFQTINSHSLNS